jgi:hypothetical protein
LKNKNLQTQANEDEASPNNKTTQNKTSQSKTKQGKAKHSIKNKKDTHFNTNTAPPNTS